MYNQLNKSLKFRLNYNNILKQKLFNHILIKNNFFFFSLYKYNLLINYTSIVKIRNRCIINGRARSVCSRYKMSRFFFKELSLKGHIVGVKKN